MNKKSKALFAVLVVIISVLSIITIHWPESNSYTISASGFFTSAAASRDYKGSAAFVDGIVVSGSQEYNAGGTGWETHYKCIIKNNQWVSAIDNTICDKGSLGGGWLELTKDGIDRQIKAGELIPYNHSNKDGEYCDRFKVCYKITN